MERTDREGLQWRQFEYFRRRLRRRHRKAFQGLGIRSPSFLWREDRQADTSSAAFEQYFSSESHKALDSQSRDYLSKVHPAIESMSFETIRSSFKTFSGDSKLADAEVKSRIGAMIANYGADDRTSPQAILDFRTKH